MKRILTIFLTLAALAAPAYGQESQGELKLNIDADLFLVNNEFTTLMKGYTLPGFRLTPTLSYTPARSVTLEGGAYMMHYWGANEYPNSNYLGIPDYNPDHSSRGVHALPFLRVMAMPSRSVTFVIGNIYGGGAHRLLPQLYSPELALTADPEAGFQFIYANRWLSADVWVDWRSFIYNNSPYRENFFVGLSSTFIYNSSRSTVHFYSPLQVLIEHRGGEIDNDAIPGINTMVNAAVGVASRIYFDRVNTKWLKFEVDALASFQQAGKAWPYDKGIAWYAHATARLGNFETTLGYYSAHKFMPVLGMPLWGVASTKYPGMLLDDPQTVTLSLKYTYSFAPGYSISANAQVYQLLGCDKWLDGVKSHESGATNFAIGVTFRAYPSFLLKRFNKK